MADFESIIREHINSEAVNAETITKLVKAINSAVGNEFVDKARYKAKLEEIDTLKAEKQTAEDNATSAEKWREKYDKLKQETDNFKNELAIKEAKSLKEQAVKAYYESKGITGKNLTIAMKGSGDEINAVELEGDRIKDTTAIDGLIADTFAGLVSKPFVRGTDTPTPPENGNNSEPKPERRAKAIADEYFKNLYGTQNKE